jgi:hypothetical protein
MGGEWKLLLLTETHSLSRGRILNRVLDLQEEMQLFSETENPEFSEKFSDTLLCAELGYLEDTVLKLTL